MAGLRQGLAPLHLKGRNAVKDRGTQSFLVREECASAQGKKICGSPLQQGGKRRSRPLPTKAIDEDVDERGSGRQAQGDMARMGWRVQCLTDWLRAKLT